MQKNKGGLTTVIKKNISGWALLIPSIILFTYIVWQPIVIGIIYSFFKMKGFTPTEFAGLKNFWAVISDTDFLYTLNNTVQYVVWSLVLGLPLPFIAAVMINEMVYAKGFFKFTTYLPAIIPGIASCLIWKIVYADGNGGLLNMILYFFGIAPVSWLGNKALTIPCIIISMTWGGFGSTIIMYLASLQGVNQELYEAARIDGAGFFRRFITVLMPHMDGILLLLAVRQIISIFQIVEQPLIMTGGGPNGASMSLGLTNYFYAFKYGQFDKSLALGVIMFIMLILLTVVYFKLDKKIND